MKIKELAGKVKTDIPAVFLVLKDKDTPVTAKVLAAGIVAYALSPIDLIPDFIPVLGYLDDVILLSALILLMIKLIPGEVWERCKKESEGLWKDGKPKKWFYAVPVLVIWLVILGLILRAVF